MKKLDLNIWKERFKQGGCILLATEYKNNRTKMPYICECGNISQISSDKFQQGSRCNHCGIKKRSELRKMDIEYIKEYALKDGTKCVSDTYINAHEKLNFICTETIHNYSMSWSNFQQNHRCKICFNINMFEKNNPRWNENRTRTVRSKYLSFDLNKIDILKDDPNYEEYLKLNEESNIERTKGNIHHKTKMVVDHIYPRIAFIDSNLDIDYDKKIIKKICNSRDNLRIISKENNTSKGGKYNQEEFIKWFENQLILELMNI